MALHCHRGGTESIEVAGAAAVGRFSAGELCSSHRGRAGPLVAARKAMAGSMKAMAG